MIKFILCLFSMFFLTSCSTSSIGYMHIFSSVKSIENDFQTAVAVVGKDSRFERNFSFEKSLKNIVKGRVAVTVFSYNPQFKEPDLRQVKYTIYIMANLETGILAVFFHEVLTSEMTVYGKNLFEAFVSQMNKVYKKERVVWGYDRSKYFKLSEAFFRK